MVKLRKQYSKAVRNVINFVICEDEPVLRTQYKNEIDKFMIQYDIDYKCLMYDGYTEEWKAYARKDDSFKIYLLDIKTARGSGLDAARLIREEYDDWTSMIIIISAYTEYRYDALSKRLMLVDFINKLDDCSKQLREALSICIKNYDKRPKSLKYTYKNVAYNVEFRHILYIEKEADAKRCVIKTTNDTHYIQGTLNSVMKLLDERFVKCSRSSAVNIEQVESYDIKRNEIIFKNKEKLNTVSRSKRKEIMNYVRGVH